MAESAAADVEDVRARLRELEDPRVRAVNQRHGDDHGLNLTKLRAFAKELGKQPDLVGPLWDTGDAAARLLAILVSRTAPFSADDLDAMLRSAERPKVLDWLVNYVVQKSKHAEDLCERWLTDPDPTVEAAGWSLTANRVAKRPEGLDLPRLLTVIEQRMQDAPDRLQWEMNACLAQIGIQHGEHRDRALAIGESLGVLKDYPTPPNCTSPYAPEWITEMVRRSEKG